MPEKRPITDIMIDHVLNTRFEQIPADTLDNTKRRILDMIGDMIGGARCSGNPPLAELVKGWGGKKESTIIGFGGKVPVAEAAFLNAISGRSFDRGPLTLVIDGDWGPYTIIVNNKPINRFASHFTETTVPVALAVGESVGCSGKDLITSLIIGDDLSARLHILFDRTPPGQAANQNTKQPPRVSGSSDNIGATAIAGRLLGFNAKEIRNAFGVCLILMGGGGGMIALRPTAQLASSPGAAEADASTERTANPGWLGVKDPFFKAAMEAGGYEETVHTKLQQGVIARRGINAAQLGKLGWSGTKDPLFGTRGGYYPGEDSVAYPERMTNDLGEKFYVEQVFKPWPGGRPTNGPTEATLRLVKNNNVIAEDVSEVTLHLSRAAAAIHYSKPFIPGDYPTMSALWNFRFAVASAIYRGSSVDANFMPEKVMEPGLQDMIKKIQLGDLEVPTGSEVHVKMKDGRVFKEYIDQVTGEPYLPMSRDQFIGKFMEQVEFSGLVSRENAERIIEMCDSLEKVSDIRKITELAGKT